eukprot:5429597-Pleurochrysis_carterae.AAC.2
MHGLLQTLKSEMSKSSRRILFKASAFIPKTSAPSGGGVVTWVGAVASAVALAGDEFIFSVVALRQAKVNARLITSH